jgi:hypothetical protein
MSAHPHPDGPRFPLRLAIPMNAEIVAALVERAATESIPKTTLARKLILEGLRK